MNYELTSPQKAILLTEQLNDGTAVSNICGELTIHEKINEEAIEKSINLFIKNNDSIRIHLVRDGVDVKQYITDYSYIKIRRVTLSRDYTLANLGEDIISEPLTLFDSNLFDFVIFTNEDGTGGFISKFHHIISDVWSISLTANEIMDYYVSITQNTPIELANNNSYIDYINDEKAYLESPKFEKSKEFWENQFPDLEFSYLKDAQTNSYDANRKIVTLSKEQTEKLQSFCKENKFSLYALFLAILNIYLSKTNNTKSSIVGTPILNRCNYKEKHTTGMFISTIPFKMDIDNNLSFVDFVNAVSQHNLTLFRNQKYPYNLLLDAIRKKFNISKNLYDVCLSYQNARNNCSSCAVPYSCKWLFNKCVVNNLDLHIYDFDNTGMISLYYDFKKDIFSPEEIDLLHNRLMNILNQVIKKPNIKLKDIEIVSQNEKNFILNKYNKTNTSDSFVSVYDLFKNNLEQTPNKLAIRHKDVLLTYKELNNLANLIALELERYSVGSGDIVALALNDSIEFVASVIATQKLGACYIPIDINYPNERIEYIINNSNAKLLLTHNNTLKSVNLNQDILYRISLNNFDYKKENIPNIDYKLKEYDLAYIIYTSGSTGKPKGVKVCHKSLSNYIRWAIKQYVNGEETNFPLFSSVAFDLTVTSIYTPICSGNTIYVYTNENPQLLLKEIIDDNYVQIIKLTPAHFSLLQDFDLSNSIVCKFILGGDILTKETCKKITSLFSHPIHIYNEYGPTEATVGCMIYEYNIDDTYTSVPIGYPIDNSQIFLLNEEKNLVPIENVGEMYISGDCLALGYTDKEKTLERFLDHPLYKGQKIYKTGDLAVLHSDGIMEYLGRSDFQVKLNGYRVELGEIQSVLLTHPSIKDVYVGLITMDDHKFLCAYYVAENKLEDLFEFLKRKLPNYMIPSYFIKLDKIPLTINGKIDKASLPLPEKVVSKYIAPQNDTEKIIQEVFAELLDVENKISVEDNFFDYYVDSLLLIKAQTILINKGIDINTQDFYNYPTIRKLADFILLKNNNMNFVLNNDIPIIADIQKEIQESPKIKKIVLFGTTGFLGIHILYYLLTQTSCYITCIIRKKNDISPIDRFISKFNFYFPNIDIKQYMDRIKIVEGNFLEKHFGLSDEVYNILGSNCDAVIDTAALVKHYGDYESFNKSNVISTKRIIDFCKDFKASLHFTSTMSVSGYGLVDTPSVNFTENDLYIGQDFTKNVYVRSKFEAEEAILESCKRKEIVASIYRLGTITNRYSDGVFQENYRDNAFLNRLEAFINLKMFPEELSTFDFEFSPVDICANFIVLLMQNKKHNLDIYHLYNQHYITGKDLVNALNSLRIFYFFSSFK